MVIERCGVYVVTGGSVLTPKDGDSRSAKVIRWTIFILVLTAVGVTLTFIE